MISTKQRPTYKLRACPRCHGDLYFEEQYTCIQCGYIEWEFEGLPLVNKHFTATGKLRPEGKHFTKLSVESP